MTRMNWSQFATDHGADLIRVMLDAPCAHCTHIILKGGLAVWTQDRDGDNNRLEHLECFKARKEGSSFPPAA